MFKGNLLILNQTCLDIIVMLGNVGLLGQRQDNPSLIEFS